MEPPPTNSRPASPRTRSARLLLRLAVVASVVVVIALIRAPALRLVARAMTVETPLDPADLIVPLYQDPVAVSRGAAALFHSGHSGRIALYDAVPTRLEALGVTPRRHEVWQRLLQADGVPAGGIVIIGRSIENQRQLAEAVVRLLGRGRQSRIIVVASRPTSRIAWIDFRRAFSGLPVHLQIRAVPSSEFDEAIWWRSRAGVITYFDAYCLWLLRFAR